MSLMEREYMGRSPEERAAALIHVLQEIGALELLEE